ncbi:MAG: hypothetical protein OJF47_001347 [Nitrospira sp.]|nr:MAG: hypothetical protein OJF47_001347 [Nitrospira sp.]
MRVCRKHHVADFAVDRRTETAFTHHAAGHVPAGAGRIYRGARSPVPSWCIFTAVSMSRS